MPSFAGKVDLSNPRAPAGGCRLACLLLILVLPRMAWPQAAVPPAAGAAGDHGVNAITRRAVEEGVLSCASRVNQVTNLLGFSASAGADLMPAPAQPDERVLPVAMEVPTEAGAAFVGIVFAPGQANGCGAAYDAVVYWPLKCDAVAARNFAGLKKIGALRKEIAVLDGGPATRVFLMPAGVGCVSIKSEVVL